MTGRVRLSRSEWFLLLALAGIQFTHLVDFMLVMPLGPRYMERMALSPGKFGLVVSMYGYCACIASLVAARFMDRFDRKKALLVLYAGFIGANFLCAVAFTYPILLMARGMAGAFGGVTAAMLMTVVSDVFPMARRGTAMGVIMSSFSLASTIGIPFGLELARAFDLWAPFAVLGLLSMLVWGTIAWVVPPIRGHLDRGEAAPPLGLWKLFTRPAYVRAYLLMTSLVFSMFMLNPFIAGYTVFNVRRPESDLKYVYIAGGLATIVSVNIVGRLADRYGKLRLFRILALCTTIPIFVLTNLPASPLWAALLVTTVFMVTASGRMVPGTALITAVAPPQERGQFMTINAAVQHIASGLAASLGGWIVVANEDKSLRNFEISGVLSVVFVVLSVFLAGRLRPNEASTPVVARPIEEMANS